MSVTFGLELGREMCRALGLDAGTVSEMVLRLSVHEPASLTVTRFVTGEEAEEMVAVVERYGLTEPIEEAAE